MSSDFNMDNFEQVKTLMGDNLGELVAVYVRTNRVHVESLRKALGDGDAGMIVSAAHAMKSSAGNLGLSGLSASAAALEAQARAVVDDGGAVDVFKDLVAKIEAQFEAGVEFLTAH